jgi:regulator of protease activity HflC (stomatin/prohibitin superfamily)
MDFIAYFLLLVIFAAALVAGWEFVSYLRYKNKAKINEKQQNESSYYDGFSFYFLKISGAVFGVALVILVCLSFKVVSEQNVQTRVCLGERDTSFILTGGSSFVSPFCVYSEQNITEQSIKFETLEDWSNAPLTAEGVKLKTTINVPYTVNIDAVIPLLNKYGTEANYKSQVFENAVWSAVRRGPSQFFWNIPEKDKQLEGEEYYSINTNRALLVDSIKKSVEDIVRSKLIDAGLPLSVANNAFRPGYVTISGLIPPDKISDAINDQKKQEAELMRQEIVTKTAAKKADRGTEDGLRVKNTLIGLMNEAKYDTLTPVEITMLLNAVANYNNAETLENGVKEGNINTWVVPAGSPISTSVAK